MQGPPSRHRSWAKDLLLKAVAPRTRFHQRLLRQLLLEHLLLLKLEALFDLLLKNLKPDQRLLRQLRMLRQLRVGT